VGRESVLTHTHGVEVTAGAALLRKEPSTVPKNNLKTVTQTDEKGIHPR